MLAQAEFHARYRLLRTQPRYGGDDGELMLLYERLDYLGRTAGKGATSETPGMRWVPSIKGPSAAP